MVRAPTAPAMRPLLRVCAALLCALAQQARAASTGAEDLQSVTCSPLLGYVFVLLLLLQLPQVLIQTSVRWDAADGAGGREDGRRGHKRSHRRPHRVPH